jgi:hypothetical protein
MSFLQGQELVMLLLLCLMTMKSQTVFANMAGHIVWYLRKAEDTTKAKVTRQG